MPSVRARVYAQFMAIAGAYMLNFVWLALQAPGAVPPGEIYSTLLWLFELFALPGLIIAGVSTFAPKKFVGGILLVFNMLLFVVPLNSLLFGLVSANQQAFGAFVEREGSLFYAVMFGALFLAILLNIEDL